VIRAWEPGSAYAFRAGQPAWASIRATISRRVFTPPQSPAVIDRSNSRAVTNYRRSFVMILCQVGVAS